MAIPGVLDAGASNCLPLDGGFGMIFDVLGRPTGQTPFSGGCGLLLHLVELFLNL